MPATLAGLSANFPAYLRAIPIESMVYATIEGCLTPDGAGRCDPDGDAAGGYRVVINMTFHDAYGLAAAVTGASWF